MRAYECDYLWLDDIESPSCKLNLNSLRLMATMEARDVYSRPKS